MKFFKFIFSGMLFVFKLIFAILNYSVLSLFKVIALFFNKLRFSIAFKINLFYGFLYLLLVSSAYAVSLYITLNFFARSTAEVNGFTYYFSWILGISTLLSLILFLFLGRNVVRKMMNPLEVMTQTVEKIKEHELSDRLNTSGAKDELKELAVSFNQLMDRLQLFVEYQKQFVSDASHELRTPIAVIEGYATMLDRWGKEDPKILEESIQSIKNEAQNMKELVEKLLFLARSDRNTLKVTKEPINLSEIADQVIKETTFIDDEHEFVCRTDENTMILGDRQLIKELIRILVDNAVKYTPEDGSITLHCARTSKNVVLSVKDTGIGIAAEHLPHLFERFYRAGEARDKNSGGTGLGLAIAKWIADTHGAVIHVSSYEGEGTDFLIFFPLTTY
ncbi:MAG: hypothetical protein K0S71_258 [Clostridia bacterium]|nr:hypothetical protein [Clostridia bacterium]